MISILILGGAVAAATLTVYMVYAFADSQTVEFDINEGIDPAITEPIEMHELRRDPSRLEALQGKVSLVSYNDEVDSAEHGPIAESWVVDSNGATITVETTFDGPNAPKSATGSSSSSGALKHAKNHQRIAERNVRIEENARWLAKMLDVPFED